MLSFFIVEFTEKLIAVGKEWPEYWRYDLFQLYVMVTCSSLSAPRRSLVHAAADRRG